MNEKRSKTNYGGKALLPLLLFLVMYVGCGVYFTIVGAPEGIRPFNVMPRYVPMMIAIIVALFFYDRKTSFGEKVAVYSENAGRPGVMQLGLVVLFAGGFSNACIAIGGSDSMVNLGISFIPSTMLIPGIFVMSAIISTCIGSSMGTLSAMLPVAFAVTNGAGLNPGMAAAACLTGAYFGDNLSMISDTTICATEGVGAKMKDKFKMNLLIALSAAIVSVLLYAVLSAGNSTEVTVPGSYNLWTILPYISVLVMALIGIDVILVLSGGITLACIIGLCCRTTDFFTFSQKVSSGMVDMFWVAVFSMLTSGLVGMIRYYGGVEWMVKKATSLIRGRKSCEYVIGAISVILSGTILHNTMAIMILAPIAKEIGSRYNIAPKRLASLLDIGACLAIMIVPHGMAVMMVEEQFNCSYLDMMKYNFYPLFLAIAVIITIQFGLMRTKEEKEAAQKE